MCHDCTYGLVGLWLLPSAFIFAPGTRGNWVNHLVTGAILVGLAGWAGFAYGRWLDWAVVAVGAWLVLSGSLFISNPRISRINTIASALFAILASFWPFYF